MNRGPAQAFLLVGGCDLTSDTFTLEDTVEELTEEVHPFGSAWEATKGVGVGRVDLQAAGGIYDDRQVGMLRALQNHGGARQLVAYGTAGTAAGADVTMLDGALVTKWKRMLARDGLTKAHAEYAVTASYMRGVVLNGRTPVTSDGNSQAQSVDNGTSSAGAIADLHVPALTLGGHTNLAIRVLASADNVTFGAVGTFTAVTAAGASQRLTMGSSVARYAAVDWDFTGTGSSPSAVVFVALKRT